MAKTLNEENFDRLNRLFEGKLIEFASKVGSIRKFESPCLMDLVVESTGKDFWGHPLISITHYFKQNGDLVPDPELTISLLAIQEIADVMTYQDQRYYEVVYPEPGKFVPELKKELGEFLNVWLRNIESQGFKAKEGDVTND